MEPEGQTGVEVEIVILDSEEKQVFYGLMHKMTTRGLHFVKNSVLRFF